MVAGIKVPVVLYHRVASAGLREDAGTALYSAPVRKRSIECNHEAPAHVIADPVIEYVAQEFPESD